MAVYLLKQSQKASDQQHQILKSQMLAVHH